MNIPVKINKTFTSISSIILSFGCILFSIAASPLPAQAPIGLKAALDSARANNMSFKNEKLKVEYQGLLRKTGANIPQALLFVENGQINSRYVDNRFGINQSVNFPTVYAKRKNIFDEEYTLGTIGLQLKELDLMKQVQGAYYHLLYLQQKEHLLLKNDSLYSAFLDKSIMRLRAGESNLLEKSSAETSRNQIAMQLRALQQDKAIYLLQLQWLLNTHSQFIPADSFKLELPPIDSGMWAEHPELKVLWQEKQVRKAYTQLEKNKLLPDLNITYSNMSMYGVGADNVFYDRKTRFQALQFGIGIPVFSRAQKSSITASRSQVKIAENNYLIAVNSFANHWQQTIALYMKYYENIEYFETTGLKNADLIIEIANQQFSKGEINYLGWAMLINQALVIHNEYLDSVNANNEAVIELKYLMGSY